MSWKAKGADRGKSYQVYQELERRYQTTLVQLQDLQAEVARKNDTIRHLAIELAGLHTETTHPVGEPTSYGDMSDVSTHEVPASSVRDTSGVLAPSGGGKTHTPEAERPGTLPTQQLGTQHRPALAKAVYVRHGRTAETLEQRMSRPRQSGQYPSGQHSSVDSSDSSHEKFSNVVTGEVVGESRKAGKP